MAPQAAAGCTLRGLARALHTPGRFTLRLFATRGSPQQHFGLVTCALDDRQPTLLRSTCRWVASA